MASYRRALLLAATLLFFVFFLYPRRPQDLTPATSVPVDLAKPLPTTTRAQKAAKPTTEEEASVPTPVSEPEDDHDVLGVPLSSEDRKSAKSQQQTTLANLQNLPFKEQLAYHFPYDVSAKFPAYIWQTWKYTPASGKFSDKFRVTEASWTEKHPDFVHEVITDQVAQHLIKHLYSSIPDVLEAYMSMPMAILKADFFRYLILLARGGIYADIDTMALKPVTDWIPSKFRTDTLGLVVGIEADPDREDWADWYSRRIQFCQWTIQSKPGHPVLLEIVTHITTETLKRKAAKTLTGDHDGVVEFTGPAVWTDAVFDYFNDPEYFDMKASSGNISWENFTGMREPKKVGDVVVLPITSFSPGIGHSGAGDADDPMAFVKHEFEGSWKPEKERIIQPKSNSKAKNKGKGT